MGFLQDYSHPKDHWTLKTGHFEDPTPAIQGQTNGFLRNKWAPTRLSSLSQEADRLKRELEEMRFQVGSVTGGKVQGSLNYLFWRDQTMQM